MITSTTNTRYIGHIVSVPGSDEIAFIGIGSITQEDGSPHGLNTGADVFLHRDDCAAALEVGIEVSFYIIPDRKRGEGTFRAVGAVKHVEGDLIPEGEEAIPGFGVAVPGNTGLAQRLPVHANMKTVPAETVEHVVANNPMPGISRSHEAPRDEETKHRLVQWFLSTLFPHMESFGTDYRIFDHTDTELDRLEKEAEADYQAIGLDQETEVMHNEVKRFKEMRGALKLMLEDNLVRPDTVIPIKHLVDMFVACPVWYYWVNQEDQTALAHDWGSADPEPHAVIRYFCELFPNQRWYDTFQLFNRRVRTLRQYKGEVIPPHVARRMRKAVELFDYVVIATPYHDEAGRDWEDIDWLRSIDPYVLGFKKGIPHFFVLARFSNAGTFPLFNELVADAIGFLRANVGKLKGFNEINMPFWCFADGRKMGGTNFARYLMEHVTGLLAAFDAGNLFDWLRAENGKVK